MIKNRLLAWRDGLQQLDWLGLTIVLMLIAGTIQNPLLSLTSWFRPVTYVDDSLLVIAAILAISRWRRLERKLALAGLSYSLVVLFSAINSREDAWTTIEIARSMMIPILLIGIGSLLTSTEWSVIKRIFLVISSVNSLYMLAELLGVRLFSPISFNENSDSGWGRRESFGGLPGNFLFWAPDGVYERAGGLFLNPPVAAIAVAGGLFLVASDSAMRYRSLLVVLHLGAVWASLGRGGMVIVALGILAPFVFEKLDHFLASWPRFVTLFLAYVPSGMLLLVIYFLSRESGRSLSHVEGLVGGANQAFSEPEGSGIGAAGNAVGGGATGVGESLLGLVFATGGLALVIVWGLIGLLFLLKLFREPHEWRSYLALAVIFVAALSESAGALAGAGFLWLAIGTSLAQNTRETDQIENK